MWASKDDVRLLNDPWRVLNKQKKYSDNFVPVNKAFVVLAVERYLSQPSDNSNPQDLYDVTLTDGSEGAKCLLQPRFNSMVYKNVMTAGCDLKVNRISTVYEGKTLRVVLNNVYVVSRLSMYFQLCHPQHEFEDVAGDIRMVAGVNKHYLPLWNDVDYYGLQWRDNVQRNIKTISEHVVTLAELEKTVEYKSSLPALLVRVMFKSTLWHNGKYSSTQEWAYQAYLEVADHTRMATLVLGNSLCPDFYRALKVGAVILLQNYVVKEAFQQNTRPASYYPEIEFCKNIDICLIPEKSASSIKVISLSRVQKEWNLPKIKYRFITRREIERVPNGLTCDVIGLVTFVGRCERIRKSEDSSEFWVRRWIHMVDGTSHKHLLLEVYCTSQPEIHEKLHPLTYLVCTQMRVVQNIIPNGAIFSYLTTTSNSQIFINGYHKGNPYRHDPVVQMFIQWVKCQKEEYYLDIAVVGGYFPGPPLHPALEDFCENGEAPGAVCDIKKELEMLQYREHKRILISGVITAIKYVNRHMSDTGSTILQAMENAWKLSTGSRDGNSTELSDEVGSYFGTRPTSDTDSPHTSYYSFSELDKEACSSPQHTLSSTQDSEYYSAQEDFPELSIPTAVEPEGSNFSFAWEYKNWSKLSGQLQEHLKFGHLLPESHPQKFDYSCLDAQLKLYNLQPSKYSRDLYRLFESKETVSGYFSLTITDLSQKCALDVVCLSPACLPNNRVYDTDTPLYTSPAAQILGTPTSGYRELFTTYSEPDHIMKTATTLEDKNLFFLLDLYSHGGGKVEVIVNRVFIESYN
ncbi:RPA-related protein RADX-like isoform X2 [Acipenser ruthenus]|uniref:RPA-related protein RADX-like isoform X2 n=1 Tax=Acipenser ruthenus TaxID=7906 RepID=UPI00274045AF|nr:RPA-related protein RADX-like isoform X2 [Acipenser ruthenus]